MYKATLILKPLARTRLVMFFILSSVSAFMLSGCSPRGSVQPVPDGSVALTQNSTLQNLTLQNPSSPNTLHASSNAIAVLGVGQALAAGVSVNQARLAQDLAALLAGTGEARVTSSRTVRDTIGAAPFEEIMATYRQYGRLTTAQIQRLMAANLPARRLLAVRLESDEIKRLPASREAVVDANGQLLADREKRLYTTQRSTQISASLFDLGSGDLLWVRQYRVTPQTHASASQRVGDSFGASLAASLTNTMFQGPQSTQYPPPAALRDSLMALLQEVAYTVPLK